MGLPGEACRRRGEEAGDSPSACRGWRRPLLWGVACPDVAVGRVPCWKEMGGDVEEVVDQVGGAARAR